MITELLISEIIIGERHRKDVGDVSDLAQSITAVGQLQPIVITSDKRLIAGRRRMLACEKIGLQTVLATVADDVTTARHLLIAERDENTCRKSFTPIEAVALGKSLEELESPAAKKRRESGNNQHTEASGNLPEPSKRQTRDIVAEAVGMSGRTYEKAKAVVAAATAPDASPEIIEAARQMNETGKVDPAFKIVQAAKSPLSADSTEIKGKPVTATDVDHTRLKVRDLVQPLIIRIRATSKTAVEALPGLQHDLEKFADEIQELADEIFTKTVAEKYQTEPAPPKVWSIDDDMSKFRALRDKLEPNWTDDFDRASMKRFFSQFANEISTSEAP